MLTVLLLAAMFASEVRPAEPEIRSIDGQVTIRAQSIPLPHLLDRLSSATGMEVRYEGARPTNRVTVNVEGVSEAAAVPMLMEGLGLSYILRTDSTGLRVDLLIVSASGTRGASLAQPGSPGGQPGSPSPEYEQPAEPDMIPVDPAALENAAGRHEPIDGNSQLVQPGQPAPNAGPIDPMRPSGVGMRDMPPAPVFPQGVSFPAQ